MKATSLLLRLLAVGVLCARGAAASACKPIGKIYKDGKDLCERLWSDQFKYVPRESSEYDLAYTMWFFDGENPNNGVTQRRIDAGLHPINNDTSVCHVSYFHHHVPKRKDNHFGECQPWRDEACCKEDTVESTKVLKRLYGQEYAWDNCGPMSKACERFFAQESCLYECDVNIGLFRKYPPNLPENKIVNTWEVFGMPIKGDYCDAFYDACANDMFCDSGDVFQCAKEARAGTPQKAFNENNTANIMALSVLVAAMALSAGCVLRCLMRRRSVDTANTPEEDSTSAAGEDAYIELSDGLSEPAKQAAQT